MRIGIPRALLYYWYGELWEAFWQQCGLEVIVSPKTDLTVMKAGVEAAVDELCLPIKIFLGHVRSLEPVVDLIMAPHLIKVERDAYICPKFMGLPDIVAHALPSSKNKILVVKVGPHETDIIKGMERAALKNGIKIPKNKPASGNRLFITEPLPGSKRSINKAPQENPAPLENPAQGILKSFAKKFEEENHGRDSHLTVGLLGHPYCLYDSFFNHNLFSILTSNGVKFLTPEMLPSSYRGIGSGRLNKNLFWTIGRFQFDALEWMLGNGKADGFVQVTPFACGPEAIVGDLLERRIKQAGKPVLKLNFEEHSGEAGIITRLEAFLDLMKYRYKVC